MIKIRCSGLIVASLMTVGMFTAQAQWSYYDISATNNSATPNTFNFNTGTPDTWASPTGVNTDGAGQSLWRYRDVSGPGLVSFGSSAFTGFFSNGDVPIYSLINGLNPNTAYMVRIYAIWPQNSTNAVVGNRGRFGADVSLDSGAFWHKVDNKDSFYSITWVDNGNGGLGNVQATVNAGDTRGYVQLGGEVVTDALGVARIDVRLPQFLANNQAQDRFNIDGFALAVPEPASMALAGMGVAMLLIFRRRP